MRKNKNDFFVPGGKKFLNGDKPDQDTFEDLTDSVTFPTELTDRAKVSESGLTKTTTDLKVNTGDDTDQSGISPLGFPVIVKPSQLWRLSTSDPQVVLTAVTRVPGSPVDSEDGSLIEDIEISLNVTPPVAAVTGADNGLTLVSNNVELGGTIIKDTTITGSAVKFWFLLIENLFEFTVKDVSQIELIGDTSAKIVGSNYVRIETTPTTGEIQILTPLLATSNPGYVLTLLDIATGECEWQALPAGNTNIYLADGTLQGNRLVRGAGNSLTFENLSAFTTNAADVLSLQLHSLNSAELISANVTLSATSTIEIATPAVNGLGVPPTLGQVLTLSNPGSGECEWVDAPTGVNTELATDNQNLTGNRIVDGGTSFDLRFTDIVTFDIIQTTSLNVETTATQIDSSSFINFFTPGQFNIKTPSFFAGTPPEVGHALTLLNTSTGECEWKEIKFVHSFIVADWTGANLIIAAVDHGKGIDVTVQVKDSVGYVLTPPQASGLVTTKLEAIKVDALGNVTLTGGALALAGFDGKVIIM